MKAYLVLLLSLITCYSFSQDVQWASEVLEFSSQFSGKDFSAAQATGAPDVLKQGGKDPKAWMASSPDNLEHLVLGFSNAAKARQIIIIESYNPGAIRNIYIYDENNDIHLIGSFQPGPAKVNNRILNIFLPSADYLIRAVKIEIDGSAVSGANSIDAVGISNSVVPVRFGEGFAFRTNPRLAKKVIDLKASGNESDIRPVYAAEENTLFFTRGYSEENAGGVNDPGDVWFSTYDARSGRYSDPVRLGDNINNIGFNTTNSYSKYGQNPRLMVGNVSGSPGKVKANLAAITKKNGSWSDFEIQKIKAAGQIPVDADYTVTDNGNVLIISSELKGSKGGTDLYVSFLEGDNKWSEPENLVTINTPEDEYAPFFSMEENALYFSSKGYNGLGGSDIFRVKRLDDSWNNWAIPENIGEDINTAENDHYFYFDDEDSYAYLAQANREGVMRIVRVDKPEFMEPNPLVVVKGKVLDEADASPVTALLSLLTEPNEELYGVTFPNENSGNYQIFLRSGYKYTLLGEKEGYNPVEMSITLDNKDKPYTYDLNIFMSKDLTASQPELVSEVLAISVTAEEAAKQETVSAPAEETTVVAVPILEKEEDTAFEEEPSYEEDPSPAKIPGEEVGESTPETVADGEESIILKDQGDNQPEPRIYPSEKVATQNLVIFNFDSDVLLSPSYPVLNAIADFMKRHNDIKLEIGGFSDFIGDYYYNIELSRRRAYSVREYLINQGIERARTRVLGFGEKMPVIASNDREKIGINRRAEFNFTRY